MEMKLYELVREGMKRVATGRPADAYATYYYPTGMPRPFMCGFEFDAGRSLEDLDLMGDSMVAHVIEFIRKEGLVLSEVAFINGVSPEGFRTVQLTVRAFRPQPVIYGPVYGPVVCYV